MTLAVPALIDGRYRVLQQLGRGGMGVVYLACVRDTRQLYAVKVLHADSLKDAQIVSRFMAEYRLSSRIDSPYIVKVESAGFAPELHGAPYLVMEFLRGCDLSQLLARHGARPSGEVMWIMQRVIPALQKAHDLGIVHRDLKPENIFLHVPPGGEVTVKLLDFGIARITESARASVLTSEQRPVTTTALGTPAYMAPEQVQGPGEGGAPISPRTDIWSVGMVLYELMTGSPYWEGNDSNLYSLLFKIVSTKVLERPSLRSQGRVNREFDDWFLKSCAHDPAQRFESVKHQIDHLMGVLGGGTMTPATVRVITRMVQALTPALSIPPEDPGEAPGAAGTQDAQVSDPEAGAENDTIRVVGGEDIQPLPAREVALAVTRRAPLMPDAQTLVAARLRAVEADLGAQTPDLDDSQQQETQLTGLQTPTRVVHAAATLRARPGRGQPIHWADRQVERVAHVLSQGLPRAWQAHAKRLVWVGLLGVLLGLGGAVVWWVLRSDPALMDVPAVVDAGTLVDLAPMGHDLCSPPPPPPPKDPRKSPKKTPRSNKRAER